MRNELRNYGEIHTTTVTAVEELFLEIGEKIEKFLDPDKESRVTIISYFKNEIPSGLPSELRGVLRQGIYRIGQASDKKCALQSLDLLKRRYYETAAFCTVLNSYSV